MITKHSVSNDILMRDEMDAPPPSLCIREKEILLTRKQRPGTGTEPR